MQRTGWGKSAVYFIATRLLRDAGAGPTILVSPLLALMRNQIRMAERGVVGRTINSENREDWEWLAQVVPGLSGSGVIYVLTVADTTRVASFLRRRASTRTPTAAKRSPNPGWSSRTR